MPKKINKKEDKKSKKPDEIEPEEMEDDDGFGDSKVKGKKSGKKDLDLGDEPKDPVELLDEEDEDDLDPDVLSKKGLHIEDDLGDDLDPIEDEDDMWDDEDLGYDDEDKW